MEADRTSAARLAHRRRINRATAAVAAGAVVATGIFAAAAAHTTRAASDGTQGGGADAGSTLGWNEDDGSGSVLTPSQSAPSQSFGPPVARSGGS
jgi:hypothetical protein